MLLFIRVRLQQWMWVLNSNTSHVIIYLLPLVKGQDPLSFKYISCYYLSLLSLQDIWRKMYSNTSHVIIYQISQEKLLWSPIHSNTSHVIIYPTYFCTLSHLKHIIILYFQAFSRFLPSSPMLSILIFLSLLHPPF